MYKERKKRRVLVETRMVVHFNWRVDLKGGVSDLKGGVVPWVSRWEGFPTWEPKRSTMSWLEKEQDAGSEAFPERGSVVSRELKPEKGT